MLHNHIIYSRFSDFRFRIQKAKGSTIWDQDGNELIDFTSGWNVTNLGWNNDEIAVFVSEYIKKNSYAPMWSEEEIQVQYAEELVKSLGHNLAAIGRATGGVEANEMAIKMARVFTGKKKILGFVESYHGQTINCMSFGNLPDWIKKITPRGDLDIVQTEFPDRYRSGKSDEELLRELKDKLEYLFSEGDFAAIITEAKVITGWGDTKVAPEGFLQIIRDVTKKYGVLLIVDEVGSGFSRLGKLFAIEFEDISPDIVTLAKGISNGVMPIGAVATTKEIADATYADSNPQSTFGWTPPACAAALKTLEIHKRDKVWEQSEEKGKYLIENLRSELSDNPFVGDIRGIGMEIGVDLVTDKELKNKNGDLVRKVVDECFEKGLHLVHDHDSNIQIMPSLVISQEELERGLSIFVDVVNRHRT